MIPMRLSYAKAFTKSVFFNQELKPGDQKPYIDNCVCEVGYGVNDNGICEACEDTFYSKGVEKCQKCRMGQKPNSKKSDCEWENDNTPKTCVSTGQLEGANGGPVVFGANLVWLRYHDTSGVTCNPDFKNLEIKRSVCYKTGDLSATVYCSKQCPEFMMKNAADNEDGKAQDYESTQVYTCLDGFGVNKDKSVTEGTATCTLGGIWYHPGHCEPVPVMKKKSWLWLIILLSVLGVCLGVGLVLFFVLR